MASTATPTSVAPTTTATISALVDDAGIVNGTVANGGSTDDTRLSLSGALSAALVGSQQLRIFDGTLFLGTASVSRNSWTFNDTRTLTHGQAVSYTARVAADTSTSASLGVASSAYRASVDTVAPAKTASIASITDDVGPAKGTVASGGATDDTKLSLNGALSASLSTGETLRVYDGAVFLGTARVTGTNWTFDDSRTLTSGQAVAYTVRVADAVGNESAASSAYRATVDTAVPTKMATISSITDDQGIVRGTVVDGGLTDDTKLVVSGTLSAALAAGETLRIFDEGVEIGTATVVGTGWTFADPRTLSNGQGVSYTARVASAAGVLGRFSSGYNANIDTEAPTTTATISGVTDNAGPVTGTVANGGKTDDTSLALTGTLARTLAAGETVRVFDGDLLLGTAQVSGAGWTFADSRVLANDQDVSYTARVADAAGNLGRQGPDYKVEIVIATAAVTGVTLSRATGIQNSTLNAGDVLTATVNFDNAVTVATAGGTPTLALNIGGSVVRAAYSGGTGTRTLTFAYTVLEGQNDTNGISIGANALALNGGAIRNASGTAATLTHVAVGDNVGYLVDTAAPTGTPAAIGSYVDNVGAVQGTTSTATSTDDTTPGFNVGATPAGATGAVLYVDGVPTAATLSGGVLTPSAALATGARSITYAWVDAAGNVGARSAAYPLEIVASDTRGPVVSSVALDSATGAENNTLNVGDRVTAVVTFDQIVVAQGSPTLALVIGGTTVQASFLRGTGTKLFFVYTVAAGQNDANGIAIAANGLALNGGTIRNASGTAATLTHAAVADNAGYLVDTAAPTGTPAAIGSYVDNVGAVQGTRSTATTTDDTTPGFNVDATPPGATGAVLYVDGVQTVATLANGVLTPGVPLAAGARSITYAWVDAAGNVGARSAAYVLTIDATAPLVNSVVLSGATGIQNSTLNAGDVLTATVTFDETVDVVTAGGMPTLALNIGGTTVQAAYTGGTGTRALTFAYTVLAGQNDANGISVAANALALNGATIRNAVGADARLTHALVADNANYLVDTAAPSVTPAAITSYVDNVGPVQSSTSTAASTDDTTPGFNVGSPPADAAGAVLFVDGVQTAATLVSGVLTPNAGLAAGTRSITYAWVDAAGNVGARSAAYGLSIDTAAATVTGVALTSAAGAQNSTLNQGDVVTATVSFTEAVVVSGAPTLALNIGGPTVQARYVGGSGGSALSFRYTVVAGQNDADGISIDANALSLAGGTIRNAAGTAAMLTHAAVASNTSYRVDTAAPVAGAVGLSNFTDTGASASDFISSDNSFDLTLHGAEAGSTVAYEVSTNGGSTWTGAQATQTGLADGSYLFRALVSDRAGNSTATNAVTVTVDRTAAAGTPAPISDYGDDVGPVRGSRSAMAHTDDTTPGLNIGDPPAGASTAWLYVDGVQTAATLKDGVLTPDVPLAEGGRSLRYAWVDAAGNIGAQSAAFALTLDTTAPAVSGVALSGARGIQNSTLNAGDVLTATITFGEAVNVATAGGTPTLALDIGGSSVQAAYSGGSGTTALTFTYTVLAGSNDANGVSIVVDALALNGGTIRDAAGIDALLTHAAVTDDPNYLVDTVAPADTPAPVVSHVDNVGPVQDDTSMVTTTDDATPGLNVGAPPVDASTAWLYVDGALAAATLKDGVLTPDGPLAEGRRALRYAWVDAAGNVGAQSDTYSLTIDTALIDRPLVTSVTLTGSVGRRNDTLNAGDTLIATVTFDEAVNVAPAGATPMLALDIGGTRVQAAYSGGSGTTALTFTYMVSAGLNDADGVSIAADALALNDSTIRSLAGADARLAHAAVDDNPAYLVDTVAPMAGAVGLSNFIDTGASAGDFISSDHTFDLAVSGAEAGSTVVYEVSVNGGSPWVGVQAAQAGLADGNYLFRAVVSDRAGNSTVTNAVAVTVDRTGPLGAPVVITSHVDNVGDVQSPVSTASPTDDPTPGLNVGATPGDASTAWLYVNGVRTAATLKDGVLTPDEALPEGHHSLRYAWADAAGNVGAQSEAYALTVDTTPPVVNSVALRDATGRQGNTLNAGDVLTATVTFDEVVNVATAGGTPTLALDIGGISVQAAWTGGSGTTVLTFTYTVPAGLNDENGISIPANALVLNGATVRNRVGADASLAHAAVAGNDAFLVDTVAPAAGALGLSNFTDTGASASDFISSDHSFDLTVSGAEAGSTVAYEVSTNGGSLWVGAQATQSGLADGSYLFRAVVSDRAGNSTATSVVAVTVDRTGPLDAPMAITSHVDNVGGVRSPTSTAGLTDDPTPGLNVGATPGDARTAWLYVDGVQTAATLAGGVLTPDAALAEGPRSLRYAWVDAAGNVGAQSQAYVLTIDTTAPMVTGVALSGATGRQGNTLNAGDTLIATVTFDKVVNVAPADATPTLMLDIGGTLVEATYSGGSGMTALTFTYTVPAGMNDANGVSIVANALALNGSTIRGRAGADARLAHEAVDGNATYLVDTESPMTRASISALIDDVGTSQGQVPRGGKTDDTHPELRGELGGALAVGETLRIYDGSAYLGNATVEGTTWRFEDTRALTDGQTVGYTARVADAAGNEGAASESYAARIDLQPPPLPTARVVSLRDDFQNGVGFVARGGRTDDPTPTLAGTLSAELVPGQELRVFAYGERRGVTLDLGVAAVTGQRWTHSVADDASLRNSVGVGNEVVFSARVVEKGSGRVSGVEADHDFAVTIARSNSDGSHSATPPEPEQAYGAPRSTWGGGARADSYAVYSTEEGGSMVEYVGGGAALASTGSTTGGPVIGGPRSAAVSRIDAPPNGSVSETAFGDSDVASRSGAGETAAVPMVTAAEVLDLPGKSLDYIATNAAVAGTFEQGLVDSRVVDSGRGADAGWPDIGSFVDNGPIHPAWTDPQRTPLLMWSNLSVIGGG